MSAEPIARNPADHVHVRRDPTDDLYRFLDELRKYLTEEGAEMLYADVGHALTRSIATGDDVYVNRAIDAWLRTLALKAAGADEIASRQVDPLEEGEEPVSLDELRSRMA